jgi:hypothetical protein
MVPRADMIKHALGTEDIFHPLFEALIHTPRESIERRTLVFHRN